jgi:nucleoside-diphosphate kinase
MSRPAEASDAQHTVCIVKPGAFQHRAAIEAALIEHGFVVLEKKEQPLTKAQVIRLYVQHYGMPHFDELVASMLSGPVCVLILSRSARVSGGSNAVAELRHLVGPTDPVLAREVNPRCLRALYGGQTLLENGVHASKSAAEAAREEDVFCRLVRRNVILFGPPACWGEDTKLMTYDGRSMVSERWALARRLLAVYRSLIWLFLL